MKKVGKLDVLVLALVLVLFLVSFAGFASAVSCEDCYHYQRYIPTYWNGAAYQPGAYYFADVTAFGWTYFSDFAEYSSSNGIGMGFWIGNAFCTESECQQLSSQVDGGCAYAGDIADNLYWDNVTYINAGAPSIPGSFGPHYEVGYCESPWLWYWGPSLQVDDQYKTQYGLASNYESQGLSELKVPGKLNDVSASDKANITGIITEYDNLQVGFSPIFNPNSINPTAEVQLFEGSYSNPISLGISAQATCSFTSTDEGYYSSLYTIGECGINLQHPALNHRGKLIFAKITLKENGQVIGSINTNYLAVANYVLQVYHVEDSATPQGTSSSWTIEPNYAYFNAHSEINKKLGYSAKYVDFMTPKRISLGQTLPGGTSSTLVTPANIKYAHMDFFLQNTALLNSANAFGYSYTKDRIIALSQDELKEAACYQTLTSGNEGGCSYLLQPYYIILGSAPPISTLSHELGHSYSHLSDEYSLGVWVKQQPNPNPVSFSGTVRFPECCAISFRCYHTVLNGDIYQWLPEGTVSSSSIPSYDLVDDANCVLHSKTNCAPGSTPNNCILPFAPRIVPGNCGTTRICYGMPYSDAQGNNPDDITLNITTAPSKSIMGFAEFRRDVNVYPKNAYCPLRGCP